MLHPKRRLPRVDVARAGAICALRAESLLCERCTRARARRVCVWNGVLWSKAWSRSVLEGSRRTLIAIARKLVERVNFAPSYDDAAAQAAATLGSRVRTS
jgi:hypothetical protein